jgi:putative hemolysin
MKWTALACVALMAGCANSPPVDNRSAPGAGQPAVDERDEARALEQAEANCASQGKHAEAKRVEGTTVYDCVQR